MNRWLFFLVLVALVAALFVGWKFPGRPEEPAAVRGHGRGRNESLTLRPGETAATAVRFLRTLRSDPPPPPPPSPPPLPPPPPPPPPPPDVAVVFRSALLGITLDAQTGLRRALVRDPAATGSQIASMGVGDSFGDGWRISEVSEYAVTLRKDRETRVVRLFG